MHRWILDNPFGDDGQPDLTDHCNIATTIIAKLWPGRYFKVTTWRDTHWILN
jgi:hypothetical protein